MFCRHCPHAVFSLNYIRSETSTGKREIHLFTVQHLRKERVMKIKINPLPDTIVGSTVGQHMHIYKCAYLYIDLMYAYKYAYLYTSLKLRAVEELHIFTPCVTGKGLARRQDHPEMFSNIQSKLKVVLMHLQQFIFHDQSLPKAKYLTATSLTCHVQTP